MSDCISVIIPSYNEESMIEACLKQFEDLKGDWELIVADGGSDDQTMQLVSRFPKVRSLTCDEKLRGEVINCGLKEVTSDKILILHADTRLPKGAHLQITKHLKKRSAGAFRIVTIARGKASRWMKSCLRLADFRARYTGTPYGDQAVFFRKELLGEIGMYPEIPFMDDWVFSKNIKEKVGPVRSLASTVKVSGRRMQNAPFKYVCIINVFPLLFHLGVSPKWLASIYRPER